MHPFSKQQIKDFEERLRSRKVELEKLIVDAAEGSRPVSLDQPIGRLSRMDALQQQSMSKASRQTALRRLEQVKSALKRLDAGTFGLCVECEEEIATLRLEARPEAPFCLECQAERERKS